jgi:hypothetical protein
MVSPDCRRGENKAEQSGFHGAAPNNVGPTFQLVNDLDALLKSSATTPTISPEER